LDKNIAGAAYPEVEKGLGGSFEDWLRLNSASGTGETQRLIAAFPPAALMKNTTGLERDEDFAAHGVHIAQALASVSPKPLRDFQVFLDFGVGVGRLARLFKGFEGRYVGVDIDADNIAWVSRNYPHVEAVQTEPGAPLPFRSRLFDGIAAISVFSHLNEADHSFYLEELRRVSRPGAAAFVTVHGERALQRAEAERTIFDLLQIPDESLRKIRADFESRIGYSFILQNGHLTSARPTAPEPATLVDRWKRLRWRRSNAAVKKAAFYEYGITFIDAPYIKRNWSHFFDIIEIIPGVIHDFQDIVVMKRRAD
jgi:SAM-dependent methyltransferase